MRRESRSERKKAERIKRVEDMKETMIHGNKKTKKRPRAINILTLFSIMLFFLTMLVISKSDVLKAGSFAGVKVEDYMMYSSEKAFKTAYEETLSKQESDYDYDKGISEIIESGKEISFKQNSTPKTNSLIGIFKGKSEQIEKVGVIGIYQEDNGHFPLGFKENAILLTSIVNKMSYNEAENYLIKLRIVDHNGNIVLKSVIFEEDGKEYMFHVEHKNNFFYTIQLKRPLLEK